jgi:hypothetical protein
MKILKKDKKKKEKENESERETIGKKYALLKDVILRIGTEVTVEPPHSVKYMENTITVFIEIDKNRTAQWIMYLEDAIDAGMIAEIEDGD